jgi:tRNA modification GTPase
MSTRPDTIFALSSGAPPSGVAVIRLSGPRAIAVVEAMTGGPLPPRRLCLRPVRDPSTGGLLDRGLAVAFPAPASATGEDCAEFHLHGGRAVVAAVLEALGAEPGLRLAGPGDFTRRAFEAGRLDLTAVEGLADLIAADTEAQRIQALRNAEGAFHRRAEAWRETLLDIRATVEAAFDFTDEDDVPGDVAEGVGARITALADDVDRVLADGRRGERIRDGYHVAILGRPNAGKSSLLNALAGREAAIVTPIPGTTRDVVEVHLDLDGARVTLADTAGLRASDDPVEREGVRRAEARARAADLVLWLDPAGVGPDEDWSGPDGIVVIRSKADDAPPADDSDPDRTSFPDTVSVVTGAGLSRLLSALAERAAASSTGEPALVTRERQRACLVDMVAALRAAAAEPVPELSAESLREAGDHLGRLTGRLGVEDVLGAIFSRFCIGK